MSLKIIDTCIACDACVSECPTDAIEVADPIYVIDSSLCTECIGYHKQSACVAVCPVDSIILDPDCYEDKKELLLKFQKNRVGL